MARIISEETYAGLVKHLAQDETVALFQKLIFAEKTAETTPSENGETQTGGNNELQQSNA